ncbi:MAG: peptidoglycan DD-metalloendopeptidase family protein [Saprospiraceae bacterium]
MKITHRQDQSSYIATTNPRFSIFLFASFILFCSFFIIPYNSFKKNNAPAPAAAIACVDAPIRFGFDESLFFVEEGKILKNDFLGKLLLNYGIDNESIMSLSEKAKNIFAVTKLQVGKKFAVISNTVCGKPSYFVYEPNAWSYVVYSLDHQQNAKLINRDIKTEIKFDQGHIESSLWDAMADKGVTLELISLMENALGSQIDFYHVQHGDSFRLIYETRSIGKEVVSVGNLIGAYFKNENKEYYAIYYESEKLKGYYDLKGSPTKKSFLKSPVEIGYISSRYNLNRFHPILHFIRPHLGTDYAARYGAPIRAVAAGTIEAAEHKGGNGLYVKIRHDKMYETQYLHMSRLGGGIHSGARVSQGQTIGYVGQSGLATGPHVCFRFWKNGKQINHLKENFPDPDPMPKDELTGFFKYRDIITSHLKTGETTTLLSPIINQPDSTSVAVPNKPL